MKGSAVKAPPRPWTRPLAVRDGQRTVARRRPERRRGLCAGTKGLFAGDAASRLHAFVEGGEILLVV